MRKIMTLALAVLLIACSPRQKTETKDMNQLSLTTEQAAWMSAIACDEAKGDLVALESAIHNGLEAELTVSQIKEALSQLYAYTGFPRSLNALGVLQRVIGDRHIFARDNLTYADRELVTVSALSGLEGVEPQLKAHIAGARNMGVSEEQLQGIVVALAANGLLNEAGRLAKNYAELSNGASTQTLVWPQGKSNDAYAQYFMGQSFLQPYFGGVANVTFEPRCRNNWHIHHGAVQVLICVSGKGWYQEWNKPAVPLTPGTVIAIPEGVKHWHGAAADSWMQHLAIHTQEQPGATNEWLEPVSDVQYNKLTAF